MKRTTLTALILTLLSSLAIADHFETLAGYRDSVTLKKGQAAIVLFVTDTPTVQYQKVGNRAVQFQLGISRRTESHYSSNYPARAERNPSSSQPLALAGPATVKLMTDGVVSLRIVSATGQQ
jgi:hypothetical protein